MAQEPEINQLLEEGITLSGQLTDTADEAMNAIDELAKGAEALAERVREEGDEACRHLRDLASRLERAEDELEGSRAQAESALDGLAAKAADLKEEVGGLLERAKKSMADLEEQKGRLDASLDAQVSETQTDFTELAGKTQELEAETTQHLNDAAQAVAAFRSAIDAARAEFGQKLEAWTTALEGLETHAQEQADAWVTGLNGLISRQATDMVETANAMVDRHNEAMAALKQRFVEQAPQELTSAAEPLRTALDRLGEDAATRQQEISSRTQELERAATEALSVIQTIEPALVAAARLE